MVPCQDPHGGENIAKAYQGVKGRGEGRGGLAIAVDI